jgi:hypothetical protein
LWRGTPARSLRGRLGCCRSISVGSRRSPIDLIHHLQSSHLSLLATCFFSHKVF